jgi:hypothetical protein
MGLVFGVFPEKPLSLRTNKPEIDFMKTITSSKIEDKDPEILELLNKIRKV